MRDLFVLVCFLLVWPEKNWVAIIGENQYQLFGSAFGVISSWLAEWRGKERSDSYKKIKKNFVRGNFMLTRIGFSWSSWISWQVNTVFQLVLVAAALLQPDFGSEATLTYITYLRYLEVMILSITLWRRNFLFPRFDLL